VRIGQQHVGHIVQLSIKEAYAWCLTVPDNLTKQKNAIAGAILKEIRERLGFLNNVGLDYLSLSRNSGTLSGGESQRIRLASQIGSGLQGVLYVLDEPSIGLHQRDNDRLLTTLKNLRDQGNTVIVVEHDEEAIREADYVFDIGPGAGVHGGQVVSKGTPAEIMADKNSVTGQYLVGSLSIPVPAKRRNGSGKKVTVVKATGNNLQNVTADYPLGQFVCVTGVSGGGKSTLTIETLFKTASMKLNGARQVPGRTRRPIRGHSRRSATGLPDCRNPRRVAINPVVSVLTSKAGVAKRVRVTVSSRSKCTSCRTSTWNVKRVKALATIAKRSRLSSKANPSRMS